MILRRHRLENVRAAAVAALTEPKNEPLDNKNSDETEQPVSYSKTEINRMNLDGLRELARNNGLAGSETDSGASLKVQLIDLLVK